MEKLEGLYLPRNQANGMLLLEILLHILDKGERIMDKVALITFKQQEYTCKKHGVITETITSTIKGYEGSWCMLCALEFIQEYCCEAKEITNGNT